MTEIRQLGCPTVLAATPAPVELDPNRLEQFLHDHVQALGCQRTALLQVLVHTQLQFNWIPAQAISTLSSLYRISPSEIKGLIDFYSFLSDAFQGQYQILLSGNITDYMLGQQPLAERLCNTLGVDLGTPRHDGRVSVAFTSCTGLCEQGPAALVNGHALPRLDAERVDQMAALIEAQRPIGQWPSEWFMIGDNIRLPGLLLQANAAPGSALSAATTHTVDEFLLEMERSGLRGRGGAGFSTYRKLWSACREAQGDAHYVVCNADEGEPGTFKDRVLLQHHADAVFEGMTLAAWIVGAKHGFLYLRGEYAFLYAPLQQTLAERRQQQLLGRTINGIDGFDFDIEIHLGAGAYVCGEESALIESLEGKRGVPRIRPPFPVTRGYLNQPTLVNNVETFACVTQIALNGGEDFAKRGTSDSTGTKLHSISGDCRAPGIYELPWGLSVRELLKHCGGEQAMAVQIGGPSGSLLFENEFDRRLDFDDVPTGGSFMVFGPQRDLMAILDNFAHFFAHESCGFCTPCRAGTVQLCDLITRFKQSRAHQDDLTRLEELSTLMVQASHCGLGKTAALPLQQVLQKRRGLLEARLAPADRPGFDLDAAVSRAIALREVH